MKIDINLDNEHILKYFPNFEYFSCTEPERLNFTRIDNLVGNQQKAFILYHILREVAKHGEIGISLGADQSIELFTIGTDHYCGNQHPIYGGAYSPHLTCECERLPFNDNTFAFAVASHILEHVKTPLETFKEWIRVLKHGGALILVMPDADYEDRIHPWDPDHKTFYTPKAFKTQILDLCRDLIETEIFDNFHNSFSFNYVGRKR